jgi:hypothetical protein
MVNKIVFGGMVETKFRHLMPIFMSKVDANIICPKLRYLSFLNIHGQNCTETINGLINKQDRERAEPFITLLNHFAKKPLHFF